MRTNRTNSNYFQFHHPCSTTDSNLAEDSLVCVSHLSSSYSQHKSIRRRFGRDQRCCRIEHLECALQVKRSHHRDTAAKPMMAGAQSITLSGHEVKINLGGELNMLEFFFTKYTLIPSSKDHGAHQ